MDEPFHCIFNHDEWFKSEYPTLYFLFIEEKCTLLNCDSSISFKEDSKAVGKSAVTKLTEYNQSSCSLGKSVAVSKKL